MVARIAGTQADISVTPRGETLFPAPQEPFRADRRAHILLAGTPLYPWQGIALNPRLVQVPILPQQH